MFGDEDIVELKSAATSAGQTSLAQTRCLDDLLVDWERNFDRLREVAGAIATRRRRNIFGRFTSRTRGRFRL